MRRRVLVLLASILLLGVTLPQPALAAPTMTMVLEPTEGTFVAGLDRNGKALWPEDAPAPDHERIPFTVGPCHRNLSPGLDYEPPGAFVAAEAEGIEVMAGVPFRFQLSLLAADGTVLQSVTLDEPDDSIGGPNIPFYQVEEAGTYTILLELLEGAAVDWELRVRGFAVHDDPTCDLWLNEVELNPDGPDPGNEWVELYNEGDQRVDVSGWILRGVGNGTGVGNASYTIPDGTIVPAEGYTVVTLEGDTEVLDDVDETVELAGSSGGVVDSSDPLDDIGDNDVTNQRVPDGGPSWEQHIGTPGTPNG